MSTRRATIAALLGMLVALPAISQQPRLPIAEPVVLGPPARYFLTLFAYQRPGFINPPKHAHTFGTMIRVCPTGTTEAFTISWLPASGTIRIYAIRPEAGRNYGLVETVCKAQREECRVSMWGPYEVYPDFGERFIARKFALESGQFSYRAVDSVIRETDVTDCIHAITDIDRGFNRGRYPLSRYGDRATEFIVHELISRNGTIGGTQTHDWAIPILGLEGYPIVRRPPATRIYPLADLTSGFARFGSGTGERRE